MLQSGTRRRWACPNGRIEMLFAWIGFLKSADPIAQDVQLQISNFLQQPYIPFHSAGLLCNAEGERSGYLAVFEAQDRAAAEAWCTKARCAPPGSTANTTCSDIATRSGERFVAAAAQ